MRRAMVANGANMTLPDEHIFSRDFARTTAALAFVLLATSLMNIVVFPQFDAVFTYARDVSVLASSVALIAIGLAAAFRPSLLRVRVLQRGAIGCLAAGAVLLPLSLHASNAIGLTVAASLAAVGRSWIVVAVGMAASRFTLRQTGLCVALAFVAYYLMTALAWVVPAAAGIALFLLLPFASLALTWRAALPVLEATEAGEAPADFRSRSRQAVPQAGEPAVRVPVPVPRGVRLPPRFGEVGGAAVGLPVIVPVAAVALVYCRRARRSAELAQVLQLLRWRASRAHTVRPGAGGQRHAAFGGQTRHGHGGGWRSWLSPRATSAARGGGVRLGPRPDRLGHSSWRGAGRAGERPLGSGSHGAAHGGLLILVFVGYALIGLKTFSFSATIAGVTPVDEAVAPARSFEAQLLRGGGAKRPESSARAEVLGELPAVAC